MDIVKADVAEFQNLKDLKGILGSPGPCVSVYMGLANPGADARPNTNGVEWRETLRGVESKLKQAGPEGRALFDALSGFDARAEAGNPQGKSLALFLSPHLFRVSWLQDKVPARAEVGASFYIRPLLQELTTAKTFYLLALSQKNLRILRCTARTAEEVKLPTGVPSSFDGYMNTDKPDHMREDKSSVGPSGGHTRGVMFSVDSTRDDRGEHLAHYFKVVDHAVNELLHESGAPLVVCAVDYELALYRTENTYPHLAVEGVMGAPNSLKSGEMHARALEALERCYTQKVDDVLAEYNHKVGSGASNRLPEVVTAAHEGRVVTLLVSQSIEMPGEFNESTYKVTEHGSANSRSEDLVNDAAVQTVLHGGQVYVAADDKMPEGAPLAAVFRF